MNEADWIQMAFPSEPAWENVSDVILIELVQRHQEELSCAGHAIGELTLRRHLQAEVLCIFLMESDVADILLRTRALSCFLNLNPRDGFNRATVFIGESDCGPLEEVIVALNYEYQGPLKDELLRHPIVPLVKRRIAQIGSHRVAFSDIFAANFGPN